MKILYIYKKKNVDILMATMFSGFVTEPVCAFAFMYFILHEGGFHERFISFECRKIVVDLTLFFSFFFVTEFFRMIATPCASNT